MGAIPATWNYGSTGPRWSQILSQINVISVIS